MVSQSCKPHIFFVQATITLSKVTVAKLGQNLILTLYSALSTSKIPCPDDPIYLFIRLTSWLLKNIVLLVIYTFLTSLDHL